MPGFWDAATQSFNPAFNQAWSQAARQKQQEEQRKYQQAEFDRRRQYFEEQARIADEQEKAGLLAVEKQKEEIRLKNVMPIKNLAGQTFMQYTQQGLMPESDAQIAIKDIMSAKDAGEAATRYRTWSKKFEPKKEKETKPTEGQKFNYAVKTYFSGGQISPDQVRSLNRVLPEELPPQPPEGVTTIGGLRKWMKDQKEDQKVTEKIQNAKNAYLAEFEENQTLEVPAQIGSFEEWMKRGTQLKTYGSAYAAWKKLQSDAQRAKFSGQPTGFQGLSAGAQAAIPPAAGTEPRSTTAQNAPQSVTTPREERQATPEQMQAIEMLEQQIQAIEDSLRAR